MVLKLQISVTMATGIAKKGFTLSQRYIRKNEICPEKNVKGPRTVLLKDCHKMAREKLKKKRFFFHEKDSRFNTTIIHKSVFLIGQVPIKKYWLKTLFLLFNI